MRYLFGPVSRHFADQNLLPFRQQGCLAFNADGDLDLTIKPDDDWEQVQARLPDGFRPEFLVLNLPYATLPRCLWTAPIARVALAPDWNLLWHYYRRCLPNCDLVLTDGPGSLLLQRDGLGPIWRANLCGSERLFVPEPNTDDPAPAHDRDIDVLFLGNVNAAVQKERMPWLGRLARWGGSRRLLMHTGVFGESCLRLLQRARIVFQFSGRGKVGRRSFEAAAAGALIFQEAGNRELFDIFAPSRECVAYHDDDLEELLDYYLDHEEERQRLAAAARAKASQLTFEHLWGELVARIEDNAADLRDRAGRLFPLDDSEELPLRCWQALGNGHWQDATLVRDLERALRQRPSPWLHNALGVMVARQANMAHGAAALWEVAVDCFRAAFKQDIALAGLNLAQALLATGQKPLAVDSARQTLARLLKQPRLDEFSREGLPLCQGFDVLRVEWEGAGHGHAGRPDDEAKAKRDLILWQLNILLARWTGELGPAYEAAVLRPDLPGSRLALGDSLLRGERPAEAAEHVRLALGANPLDRDAAQLYVQALDSAGDHDGKRRLVAERQRMAQAAPSLLPTEPWFAEATPRGNELASIIVFGCRQPESTRRCLENVLRQTRPPYELILVDRPDASRELEAELRKRSRGSANGLGWGPERVHVVPLTADAGFVAAVNQALQQIRGRFLVLLDPATVVTPGWLEGLVKWSLHDWPGVGLVGPVVNNAAEPRGQGNGVPGPDLNAVAAERRRTYFGRCLNVPRLTDSCLLARREVLERIGPLDERFPDGAFAVDDWCLRAREAGFRLLLAQDVGVFRPGNAGYPADICPQEKLREGLEVLRAKWGPESTAGYSLPPKTARSEANGVAPPELSRERQPVPSNIESWSGKPRVSLCMIVRNEERNLPACLLSVTGLFDEIIVVDTGSADRTRELAREAGARVFEFPWIDSFAAARNESLAHANGRWIMWLDADDRLDDDNRQRLKDLLASLGDEPDAYAIKVRSVLDAERTGFRLLDQVRLFPNRPDIRWDFRIHEQILPAINRAGGGVRWAPVVIDHVGYQDADMRRTKLDRNLRLLEMDAAERPDDSFSLFNLGWTLLDLGRAEEALAHLQKSLQQAAPQSSILRKLYHLLALCHRQLGRPDEALKICREGLAKFADEAELLLEAGLLLRDRGDFAAAEHHWLQLLGPRQANYFGSEEVGLRGYRTRQLLAEVYARQERWLEAEVQCRAALAERGDFEPAWLGLADIFLRQSRLHDLEDLLQKLDRHDAPAAKVAWLRARGQTQRQEFVQARTNLGKAISLDPVAIGPRVLLSHVLLQEGRDWTAAERSLRDILVLDPQNQEAQHNLQVLLRNRARETETAVAGAIP